MPEFLNYLASLLWQFTDKFYANFINERRYESIAKGIGITIEVSFLAIGLGVLIGFAIAAMKLSNNKWLQRVANSYVSILRGTPVVTQLLIFNFVIFGSISLDKVFIAVIAFGVNSGAYVSEIMRAGILSIDHGQTEAGRSLGFNAVFSGEEYGIAVKKGNADLLAKINKVIKDLKASGKVDELVKTYSTK